LTEPHWLLRPCAPQIVQQAVVNLQKLIKGPRKLCMLGLQLIVVGL
jgi:hypothetical protein